MSFQEKSDRPDMILLDQDGNIIGGIESKRPGRPKVDNPKNKKIEFRADKDTIEKLDYCCSQLNKSRSEIVRLGIDRIFDDIKK